MTNILPALYFILIYLSYGYAVKIFIPKLKFNMFIKVLMLFFASIVALILILMVDKYGYI